MTAQPHKWQRPATSVTPIDTLFGPTRHDIDMYMPQWTEIPEDFRYEKGEAKKWIRIVDDLFFYGAMNITFHVKDPTVDQRQILRHVKMLLTSFDLSHEHKTSGVAYLLSLWCTDVTYQSGKPNGQ